MMQSHHIILTTRASEGGSSTHGVILFKLLDVILRLLLNSFLAAVIFIYSRRCLRPGLWVQ